MEKEVAKMLNNPRTHFGMPEIAGRPSVPKRRQQWKEERWRLSLGLGSESSQNMRSWAREDGVLYMGAPIVYCEEGAPNLVCHFVLLVLIFTGQTHVEPP